MKMSDNDSYDSDDYGILKKALNVELPSNFNPDKVPQTGEEYLQHVMYERTKCKTWITADIDVSKFQQKQTFKLDLDNAIVRSKERLIPPIQWQMQRVQDFNLFRKFITSKMDEEPTLSVFDENTFLQKIQEEEPKFSEIILYSQAAKIRMLQIISKLLDPSKDGIYISTQLGSWLYAILALLEKPLSPSSCHTLREFAKKCLILRSKLTDNVSDELYNPLNLFICIIARFYNQLDLADGAA